MPNKALSKLSAEIKKELAKYQSASDEAEFMQKRVRAELATLGRTCEQANDDFQLASKFAQLVNKDAYVLRRQVKIVDKIIALESEPFDRPTGSKILKRMRMLRMLEEQMLAALIVLLDEARKLILWADHPDSQA